LNQSHVETIRQEKRARAWAYKNMITLDELYVAFCKGVHDQYELASELGVTDEFLSDALAYYKSKYGLYYKASGYVIYFEPFGIMKVFPDKNKV
jgi:hypothetical protein